MHTEAQKTKEKKCRAREILRLVKIQFKMVTILYQLKEATWRPYGKSTGPEEMSWTVCITWVLPRHLNFKMYFLLRLATQEEVSKIVFASDRSNSQKICGKEIEIKKSHGCTFIIFINREREEPLGIPTIWLATGTGDLKQK